MGEKDEKDALGNGDDPASVEERQKNGETVAELFPMGALEGDDRTPQNIIKRGIDTTVRASLSKAEVPIRGGGLFDPGKYGRALVRFLPGAHHPLPLREDSSDPLRVTGWKITQDLRAIDVAPADDVGALVLQEFRNLCAQDARAAAEVHAQMAQLLESELQQA